MPHSTGQVIYNRYRIVKLLGKGGFGAVYRAWDINRNSPCAIKENLDNSPVAQRQFMQDASRLFELHHPNLPKVVDAFSLPGQGQYLVMDFVEGDDLRHMLARNDGPLPEAQVLPWLMQVCDALTYLHSQTPPVIHGDLKPVNIRIIPQGQAVVVEFGISKVYDLELRANLETGPVSPGFSPLEQYGLEAADIRSDVYALGATAYNLLTGIVPPPSMEVLLGNAQPPSPAHVVNPQVSPHVSAAIQRAMALEADDRFASVIEFKQALQSPATVTVKQAVTSAEQVEATTAALKRAPASRKIWAAAVAGLVILGLLAVFLLTGLGNDSGGSGKDATSSPTQLAAQVTSIEPSPTPVIEATSSPVPSATFSPTATLLPTESGPTLEPSPTLPPVTDTAAPANEEMFLQDWVLTEFNELTTGCPLPGGPCWSGKTSRLAGDSTPLLLKLTSADFILIKKEWESPTLVFWHHYVTRPDSYVVTSILLGSAEIFLKQYTGTNGAGCYDAMDLSKYKDRLVKAYFYAKALTSSLDKPFSAEWIIQDVRIYPEFEQEMLPGVEWCK